MDNVKNLINSNKLEEALSILNSMQSENDQTFVEISLYKGKIFCKQQKWGEAINQFNNVLDIDANNTEAKSGVEMARSILGFFNPDMFNP